MRKCFDCGKRIWPWQKSDLAGDLIHAKCHQQFLNEICAENKLVRRGIRRQIHDFERKTGTKSNVQV